MLSKLDRHRLLKAALATLAVALVIGAWMLPPIRYGIAVSVETFRGMGVGGALLFIFAYALAALLLVPGSALTIAAGALYGFALGYLVVAAGSLLAVAGAYGLSRSLLRDRVERWAGGYPIFQAVRQAMEEKSGTLSLLIRLSPVFPFSISNYILGLVPMPFWKYMAGSWIGMAPGTLLYIYIGVLGQQLATRSAEVSGLRNILLATGLAATVGVVWILTRAARKILQKHLETTGSPQAH